MESIRINFEVPKSPLYSSEYLGAEFRERPCRLSSVVYSIYKDKIYIVSIWSNRQDRAKLFLALKEEAKGM